MKSQVQWKTYWEHELKPSDHAELAEYFRTLYGEANAWAFEGNRSFALGGARPEFRIIGYDDKGVAAHTGVLRRFLRVGTVDQLVADCGLLGVRPDLQRSRVSYDLLVAVRSAVMELKVPFAFGAMREELRRLVLRANATILPDVQVRATSQWDPAEMVIEDHFVYIDPIMQPVEEWPPGKLIDRNGPPL
jgi:nodulation protein A